MVKVPGLGGQLGPANIHDRIYLSGEIRYLDISFRLSTRLYIYFLDLSSSSCQTRLLPTDARADVTVEWWSNGTKPSSDEPSLEPVQYLCVSQAGGDVIAILIYPLPTLARSLLLLPTARFSTNPDCVTTNPFLLDQHYSVLLMRSLYPTARFSVNLSRLLYHNSFFEFWSTWCWQ